MMTAAFCQLPLPMPNQECHSIDGLNLYQNWFWQKRIILNCLGIFCSNNPQSLQLGGRSRIFWGRWMCVVRSKTLPSSCTLCSMRQHCLISTAGSSEGFLTWHLITPAQIIECTRCGKKVTPDIICCFLGKQLEWVTEWLTEWVSEWVSTV